MPSLSEKRLLHYANKFNHHSNHELSNINLNTDELETTQEDSITQFLDWVQTKPSYKVVRDEIKLYNEGKSSKENIIKAIAKTGFAEDKNWSSKITSILNNRIDGKHKGELETLASNLFKDTNDTKN